MVVLPQFFDTLFTHMTFIIRCLSLPANRLPRILAEEAIRQKAYWVKKWAKIFNSVDMDPPVNFCHLSIKINLPLLRDKLIQKELLAFTECAQKTLTHDLYSHLAPLESMYFNDELSAYAISLIFRTRGGLLKLNARAFTSTTSPTCTICNLNVVEDTFHFIGVCPIFSSNREKCFGEKVLDLSQVLNILKGNNYFVLYKYISNCLKYRELILNEFI